MFKNTDLTIVAAIIIAMALLIGFFVLTMDSPGLYQAQCGDLAFTFEIQSIVHKPSNPETGLPIYLGDDCTFELIRRY
jgi:hypothetical protein